jgi:drug/metabolite transporter (DMT)-like permease
MYALVWPSLHDTEAASSGRNLSGFAILVAAALAFAVGSVLSRRFHFQVDTFAATTWQLGAASAANFAVAIAGRNFSTAQWTTGGVLSILYLAIFGSVVGLTAYVYLLKHVPVTKVSTYAFVNPVIAVLIGVAAFHERLAPPEVAGIILFAVATVILSRTKTTAAPSDPMLEVPIEE